MRNRRSALFLTLVLSTSALHGGVYNLVEEVRIDAVDPFAIVHPIGYASVGGVLPVRVCVESGPGSDLLVHPVQKALQIWNELEPQTQNCTALEEWEDLPNNTLPCLIHEFVAPANLDRKLDIQATLVHELGHCGVGLGHVDSLEYNRDPVVEDLSDPQNPIFAQVGRCDLDGDGCCFQRRSFTNSINVTGVASAEFEPRGARTNSHLNVCPFGGTQMPICSDPDPMFQCPDPAECCPDPVPGTPIDVEEIHWYRIADNNPFRVDGTVIDTDTYSRSINNLPGDSLYAESANMWVGGATGWADTHAAMYSVIRSGQFSHALAADDVNMVKMGMTGDDRIAGTSDDYVIDFQYVEDCAQADIVVSREKMPGLAGMCENLKLTQSPGQGFLIFHYTQEPITGTQLQIKIGDQVNWYYGPKLEINGSCPGAITLEISDALPNTNVAVLQSPSQGRAPIPGGPCAGKGKLDLGSPQLLTTIAVDATGAGSLSANVPAGACGAFLQPLDSGTCVTGAVEAVP